MTNLITRFIDWLLPERTTKITLIKQLIEENSRVREINAELRAEIQKKDEIFEKRFELLETRIEKDSCFRHGCNWRLTINELLQSKGACTANNKDCTSSQD
jgi:capsule polysaccharide export protein KpsC/LpsZ